MKKRLFSLLILWLFPIVISAQTIPSPEDTFGFRMGSDYRLIDWNQIVSYITQVGRVSDRVTVEALGKSTLGKPFLMVTISSASNLKHLSDFKAIQHQLANPYTMNSRQANALTQKGKAVILITLNIHSTEIGSSQESVELVYRLATTKDPKILKILNRVILLLIPSLNPDGQQMVVDWYRKTVHTPYDGSPLPRLYHYYAGHDDNRDWFMFNLQETRLVANVLYKEWFPEVIYDQHQMGNRSVRFFLPPYSNPVNPNVYPLITAMTNMIGKHAAADLQEKGFKGVATGTVFNGYFEGTMSKTPFWHNRIGILSEAASTRLASPLFFPKTSLYGMRQDLPEYKMQTNFPDPWPGGWWHLRDIIDYEEAATFSILDFLAQYRQEILMNFYKLNRKGIRAGEKEPPFAYVVPGDQWDPNAAIEMLKRLQLGHVMIYKTIKSFTLKNRIFPAGSFVIPLAQPERPYIRDLMGKQVYPDLRIYPGGPPRAPYDITAWTLPLQMGVTVFEADEPVTVPLKKVRNPQIQVKPLQNAVRWIALERRWLHTYKLVNQLLKRGETVFANRHTISFKGQTVRRGSFDVPVTEKNLALLNKLLKSSEVIPVSLTQDIQDSVAEITLQKIGIYQSYLAGMDEGWTRWVLDHFSFPYRVLHNDDFRKNRLGDLSLIIFPLLSSKGIESGFAKPNTVPVLGTPQIMPKYAGGLGKKGIRALRRFLEKGGTALFFSKASDFAIEKLGVPAKNILKGKKTEKFYAPGTLLKLKLDPRSPLTTGMPSEAAVFFRNDPVFRLSSAPFELKETGVFPQSDLLLSGWLKGENVLHGKVALADIPYKQGRVILYGFRVQHRSQMFGTFKLFFNALYRRADK
ncbi:zinc carboxypeptidase [bacterium BMS3Abin05]|nr:zinc carboxypeptidase [bacterium BMS3Abin05]